jgi:HEAT repeat protein
MMTALLEAVMPEAQALVTTFVGNDPIAGARALQDLVAIGDAGEDAVFAGPIRLGLTQTHRRWLRYVASRPDSVRSRLLDRLDHQHQFNDGRGAAYLFAGLPQSRSSTDDLYARMTENFTHHAYGDFAERYMAWGFAGGDGGTLWHLVKDDSFKWEKLRTFAFRAGCASCARVNPNNLWALEQFVTLQRRDYEGVVEIPNDPEYSISHNAVTAADIDFEANYTFVEWRRGELADEVLRSWSSHPHWRIREFGAHILSTLGFQRTQTPIVAWLRRELVQPIRSRLLHALERMGTAAAANVLLDYYLESNEGGAYVAKSAWRAKDKAPAVKALNRIARDGGAFGAEALVSLGRLGEHHQGLLNTLEAGNDYSRLNAALALGYLRHTASIPRLVLMQAEASGALERIALAAALALMKHPDAALELQNQLTIPAANAPDVWSADMFLMHRYLQEAVLDGLEAGEEQTREALTAWRAEFAPLEPVAKPVISPAASVARQRPGSQGSSRLADDSTAKPLNVFISYSHRDEKMRVKLGQHLATLINEGAIHIWHDREIEAGADWEGTIDQEISNADVILLLVSAAFLASPYCRRELVRALARRTASKTTIVPIILRHCDWQGVFNAKDYKAQALPRDDRPVSGGRWPNQDVAFAQIVKELRTLLARLRN